MDGFLKNNSHEHPMTPTRTCTHANRYPPPPTHTQQNKHLNVDENVGSHGMGT